VEIQRGPGRSSGRRKQRRLSHSVEDELHGQSCKQHTGYPADNVGARLPQTAHKALRNEHGDIGDSEADRDHQHDRSPFQPDLRATHDQHDSRKIAVKLPNVIVGYIANKPGSHLGLIWELLKEPSNAHCVRRTLSNDGGKR
jgi:hypothetical protein